MSLDRSTNLRVAPAALFATNPSHAFALSKKRAGLDHAGQFMSEMLSICNPGIHAIMPFVIEVTSSGYLTARDGLVQESRTPRANRGHPVCEAEKALLPRDGRYVYCSPTRCQ
jgi:hypothetical protein